MPKPHAAAVRAHEKYKAHFGMSEDDLEDPDLPGIVTREYEPLVKAVRNVRDAAIQYGWLAAVNELNAALRDVVGE